MWRHSFGILAFKVLVLILTTERTGQPSSELARSVSRREADKGVWWESIILTWHVLGTAEEAAL